MRSVGDSALEATPEGMCPKSPVRGAGSRITSFFRWKEGGQLDLDVDESYTKSLYHGNPGTGGSCPELLSDRRRDQSCADGGRTASHGYRRNP